MTENSVSHEMQALSNLFNEATRAKEHTHGAREKVFALGLSYQEAQNLNAILAYVENTLVISIQTIKTQQLQQQKIEALEARLQELESPRIVKLDKSSAPAPK